MYTCTCNVFVWLFINSDYFYVCKYSGPDDNGQSTFLMTFSFFNPPPPPPQKRKIYSSIRRIMISNSIKEEMKEYMKELIDYR